MNTLSRTVLQIIEFLDRKAKVVKHSPRAAYTYVGGRQYPSKLVSVATEQRYLFRKQRKEDYEKWGAAMAKFQNEKNAKDEALLTQEAIPEGTEGRPSTGEATGSIVTP